MKTRAIERLTESSLATIYGCCGLFDMCSDVDVLSLSLQGSDKFLDWIAWQASDVCNIQKNFITWVRPEYSAGSPTGGYLADPCADPSGTEWGECDFVLTDFARLRRVGPTRDVTEVDMKYCEAQPRYRLDGAQIVNDKEYDMRVAGEVLLQDLRRMIITGNAATGGQFDGLEQLVADGYTDSSGRNCDIMDSLVIDWANHSLSGGAGITINGNAIGATYDFVDILLDVFRRIRQRISWSPTLASQPLGVGDIVLVMPSHMTRCLLDFYTCWSVCEGQQYNEANLQTFEARTFRNGLMGGTFGDGRIFLDGFEIPLLAYDWELTKGPSRADIYMLTGQIGNVKTIHGQYLNMNAANTEYPEADYFVTDGGRILGWSNRDHTCVEQVIEMRPRLLSWAPWANVRFQDVRCDTPLGPISPDPTATSFFPESSFEVAEC